MTARFPWLATVGALTLLGTLGRSPTTSVQAVVDPGEHRTSSTQNLAQLANVSLTSNQLAVTLPKKSVTTYLMTNVTVP